MKSKKSALHLDFQIEFDHPKQIQNPRMDSVKKENPSLEALKASISRESRQLSDMYMVFKSHAFVPQSMEQVVANLLFFYRR